jgi:hypothetical protein
MKQRLKYFLFIMLALGCDRDLKDLKLINNSDITVMYAYSNVYPDTSLSNIGFCGDERVNPHKYCMSYERNGWESEFNHNSYGILNFFVLNAQTVDITPWDTIVKYHMVLKRYEYSVQDMDSLHWTITYP